MDINNPQIFDHIVEANGASVKVKVIDLGPWDMDATDYIDVPHGLTLANILFCKCVVFNDAGSQHLNLEKAISGGAEAVTGGMYNGTTNIRCTRVVGGLFDNIGYDDAVMNRGYLTIFYVD